METMANSILELSHADDGVLSLREVSGILRSAGHSPKYKAFGGLLAFIEKDPRFTRLEDGRIVLNEQFPGSLEELEAIQPIEDVPAVINQALPYIKLRKGTFEAGGLLGTLKALGYYVREDQISEVFESLATHPNITPLSNGKYVYSGDERLSTELPEIQYFSSLDAMIRSTIGNGTSKSKKPRSKRRGGWHRIREM